MFAESVTEMPESECDITHETELQETLELTWLADFLLNNYEQCASASDSEEEKFEIRTDILCYHLRLSPM